MAQPPNQMQQADLAALGPNLGGLFDPAWYKARYRDVQNSGFDPLMHFLNWGAGEGRDPNRWFDGAWYQEHYPDASLSGLTPLMHYLSSGAAERRNPHPRFDAAWYVDEHPEAANNPLLHHLLVGAQRGWLTEKPIDIRDYLPSTAAPFACPPDVAVDVVLPVYRGLAQTRRCLDSVLADPARPAGRVIVVDDRSPEPELAAWLDRLAAAGRIELLRNRRNAGFVASANRGMQAAGTHDVVLLNSDTEVPAGWLRRLAAQAYASPRIASVSPFSNHATICGYPRKAPSPIPFGMALAQVDAACQQVNAGRRVELPTTVGSCMYIRRAALEEVGGFDEQAFGRGYGEENDFCMRAAARGWSHVLACDTFVYHEGSVSFGAAGEPLAERGMDVMVQRYPQYRQIVARHVRHDAVGPCRFAVTAALFRQSGMPVILMLSHQLGGGVQRHIASLVHQLAGQAHVLLLRATTRGTALSVPAVDGHPEISLSGERVGDMTKLLRSCGVSRAHVHHLSGMDLDARKLLHRLDVPFDLTVHDYFALCPQVNLLPWREAHYCGEPGPAACNACIADLPSHAARDILAWRGEYGWLFREAERVICPSEDAHTRLARHGLAQRAMVVPHEPVTAASWPLRPPRPRGERLRVALLGVLAPQKGAHTVLAVAEAADPARFEFHLIGYGEEDLADSMAEHITVHGEYEEGALPGLLAQVKPHLAWFPAQWPETYSYTLSAAIDAGLPIVATRIGAFVERLDGRPMSWLLDPRASTAAWLDCFETVRAALHRPTPRPVPARTTVSAFYPSAYLQPALAAPAVTPRIIDLRQPGRTAIVVVPERFDTGALSPCAYIRLLLPFDHPTIGGECDVVLADAEEAQRYRADIVATQRYAVPTLGAVDALAAHCRATGAALLYDMDDDLLHIPASHSDAAELRPKARLVQRLLRAADAVWVSTPALASRIASVRPDAQVVGNALDERLWAGSDATERKRQGAVRVLCMGTATHDADFAIVQPALARLKTEFGPHLEIDLLGFTTRPNLPDWINRPALPVTANGSYPGFVNCVTQHTAWDIGLAPLADTPFNRCKSAIKTLDYAALGLTVLASDVTAYRGSIADGPGGMLVPNRAEAWYIALSPLLRDRELRWRLGDAAYHAFTATGTLACQAEQRRTALLAVPRSRAATRPRRNGHRAAAA